MNRAFAGLRPDEAATLQSLGEEAEAIPIPPKQFDQIATSTAKDEDVAGKGIRGEFLLNDTGQAIKTTAHVSHASGEPDPGVTRQTDHR